MTQRGLLVLVLLALLAAACTAGDEPTADPSDPTEAGAPSAAATTGGPAATGDATFPPPAPGTSVDVPEDVRTSVAAWIAEESGLSEALRSELALAEVTTTRDVLHLRFAQLHDDVAVRGAEFTVHVRDGGQVLGASRSLSEVLPGEGSVEELPAGEAVEIAEKSVPGTPVGESQVDATWLETGEELRLGWEVLITTTDPPSGWAVVVDATDGTVLAVDTLAADLVPTPDITTDATPVPAARVVTQAGGCDAPPAPSACVFVVDPIYASGDPGISPDEADRTLVGVPLRNLLDPGGAELNGRYARIAPQVADDYADPDGVHGEQGRGGEDITFEAGMTYYWIDYTQQVVQELGYAYHADDPVEFVPIEQDFPDNAFYTFTDDRIHMGVGGDGVNEAEDAQGIIHEYGHALLQAAVPNITTAEGGAFHEGFADLVSVFTTIEFRQGDVACLFHWAERGDCLRRVDGDLVYPEDLRFEVHADGEIYTGAVWDVFTEVLARDTGLSPEDCQDRSTTPTPCDAVRDQVYGTLLGSLPFLTPGLDLDDAATAFAASDRTFYDGANAQIITDVFAAHGLAADGTPAIQIEGLGTGQTSGSYATVKVLHEYRGDLSLRLDVVDAGGQPLCAATLLSPNPQDDGDNVTGRFDLVGTDCESFLPPGPDQRWLLTAVDTLELDEGQLFQFGVLHQGRRFLAAGLPAVIPDVDPLGVAAVIGGEAPADVPAGDDAPATPEPMAEGTVTGRIEIAHTYVGDLQVQVLVGDLSDGTLRCRVDVRQPDPQDDSDDLAVDVDLSACGGLYPPGQGQVWLLRVADVAALDVGEVVRFALTGPDGVAIEADVPVAIPDEDQTGVLVPITG